MSYSISPDGNRIGIVATDPEPASRARDRRDKRDVIWVEHTETVHRLYLVNTKTWRSREVPTLTDMDSLAWSEQDFDDHIMAVNYASQGETFKPGIPLTKNFDVSREGKRVVMFPRPTPSNPRARCTSRFCSFLRRSRRRVPTDK